MNRIVSSAITVMVLAAVVLGGFATAFADDEGQPEIVIPKMRMDFGKIFERETYEYKFIVKNTGKADLLINNVKPG